MVILLGAALFVSAIFIGYFVSSKKYSGLKCISQSDYENLLIEKSQAQARVSELEARLVEEKKTYSELQSKQGLFIEQITQKVLLQNSESLREKNEKSLGQILNPLREKLSEFEKKVVDSYSSEARERFALKKEIDRIVEINQKISVEANNLTNALKGDVKTQGNWGEILLEKILESAGLREGEEFTVQGRDMNLQSDDGRVFRPDVIVQLPDNKHLIVDSKVSLLSFERFANATDKDKPEHLKAFLSSVQSHVRDLSDKHYQALPQLNSPDFVFLFMPIEAAFYLYTQEDKEGFSRAWERKIMIVGPSTLWPCLRTVASLWKTERQTRHALEIAQHAGSLYDKFVGFIEDFSKIGKSINDVQNNFDEAFLKLRSGKGNLIRQTERLRELGAKTKKKLERDALEIEESITEEESV
ncbi:MAG: DNA recombination protein RmuC [Proteobacteria bacterium]|nr:DNA recombination protein RmuC [Pseudomonadota bacterium]